MPGFNSMRVPSRFIVLVVFGLSILSGYGACKLTKKFENKFGRDKALISVVAITLLILIESIYIPIGYNVSLQAGDSIPEVYKWLANEKDDFAIVELPIGYFTQDGNNLWYDTKYMYYSTYHWKKLVNGYSGFFPDSYIQILTRLQEFPSEASISLLKQIHVRYVIIHSSEMDRQKWDGILNEILKYKDLEIINIFGKDYVIQVGSDNGAVQRNSPPTTGFLSFAKGWNQFEVWNGIITRWMENNGSIKTYYFEEKGVTISFDVTSFYKPRTIEVYINDELISQTRVSSWQKIAIKADFEEGNNAIRFYSPEGCQRPIDIPELNNKDPRCVSLAFQNITIN